MLLVILPILVTLIYISFFSRPPTYFSAAELQVGANPTDRAIPHLNSEAAIQLDKYLFANNETGKRKGKRTDGAIIIKGNKVLFEKYARGYDQNKKHITWSISKTVVGLMYGIALNEGRVNLNDSICKYDTFSNPKFCSIEMQHLLNWSSGIKWSEDYENTPTPKRSTVLAMLFGEGRRDMANFVKSLPIENPPGTAFRYSSGDSILAAHLLTKIYADTTVRSAFKEKLFIPAEMTNSLWESDAANTIAGAYYFQSTLRDLAQIGLLLKNHGTLNGHIFFSEEYYKFLSHVSPAFRTKRLDHNGESIAGASLWINDPDGANHPLTWPDMPLDTVAALGHWGQIIVAYPALDGVAVRIGDTRDKSFKRQEFVRLAGELLKGEK